MPAILQDMIDNLSRAAIAADPTDLAGLADIHSQLEAAGPGGRRWPGNLCRPAASGDHRPHQEADGTPYFAGDRRRGEGDFLAA